MKDEQPIQFFETIQCLSQAVGLESSLMFAHRLPDSLRSRCPTRAYRKQALQKRAEPGKGSHAAGENGP